MKKVIGARRSLGTALVRAVVPALPQVDRTLGFSAILPDSAAIVNPDDLKLYVLTGSAADPLLHPAGIAIGNVVLRPRVTEFPSRRLLNRGKTSTSPEDGS